MRHKWNWSEKGNGTGKCTRCGLRTKRASRKAKRGDPRKIAVQVYVIPGAEPVEKMPACVPDEA